MEATAEEHCSNRCHADHDPYEATQHERSPTNVIYYASCDYRCNN